MSCRFAYDGGAYVLGALSPADRQEFERHLSGCADCTRGVGELAGLPGLLGRVDASILQELDAEEPVPATLLPALHLEVRRARRRRGRAAAALATAAAVAVVALVVTLATGQPEPDTTAVRPGASSSPAEPAPSDVTPQRMQPVGDVPVQAAVTLERVSWGTRLGLVCTYDAESVDFDLPPEVDYTLHVRTRDGRAERVGSWRSIDGQSMRFTAGTASTPAELESVEVRTLDGLVVLRLAT